MRKRGLIVTNKPVILYKRLWAQELKREEQRMIPVILSGGSGTRLWPVSRASYPKQFCDFYDRSFLRDSLDRVKNLGDPRILTVESMKGLTIRVAKDFGLDEKNIIYEPMSKNTGPAVALLCHLLNMEGKSDEIVGIFPSDHLVADQAQFQAAVNLAIQCASSGGVVTLGIQPSYPATGYGYIEVGDKSLGEASGLKACEVKGFREKPSKATAEDMLKSGHFYWNAGMFVFKVSSMIEAFREFLPELWRRIESIKPDFSNAKIQYANCENISMDYGIMEKLKHQICIPCDIGWSDVGSWDELARLSEEYPNLRTGAQAHVFSESATGNYVFSIRPKVVGLLGVDQLIVVDTPDALLVAKRGESQKVKEILNQVKQAGLPEATEHPFEYRPWGGFEVLADKEKFKVKTITVDPGQQLSYQSHAKRAEHWMVVEGEAEVVLDDIVHKLKAGQSIYIPQGSKHRMRNSSDQKLSFVEVQTGAYFGEDDIVRYQDDYNRA
jgi:mannose-1-phosphate guanylyltransferase/mannose-1-phosphate guanylyltransferase/mannose-6-phosphate isomerase